MEIEGVENLLDYVFTPGEGDFSLAPSMQEYKKLQRIMRVMINFYKKGSVTKKAQLDDAVEEMKKIEVDMKMVQDQIDVLQNFPPIHPKRGEYEEQLEKELEEMKTVKDTFQPRHDGLQQLYDWSLRIVEAVEWLGKQLEAYCNAAHKTTLDVNPHAADVTVEQFLTYKRGLDEITYNLQESQDFFNASLDGRLKRFHVIEKNMIEAQLEAIRKYPADNARRKHVEEELAKDLGYVLDNMKEDPKVMTHRERMKLMHEDFFALLKWQREKLLVMPSETPQNILGDIAQLLKALAAQADQSEPSSASAAVCPVKNTKVDLNELPDGHPSVTSGGVCPVAHKAKKPEEAQAPAQTGKPDLNIYRLYEKDEAPKPSLVM